MTTGITFSCQALGFSVLGDDNNPDVAVVSVSSDIRTRTAWASVVFFTRREKSMSPPFHLVAVPVQQCVATMAESNGTHRTKSKNQEEKTQLLWRAERAAEEEGAMIHGQRRHFALPPLHGHGSVASAVSERVVLASPLDTTRHAHSTET